MNGWKPCPFCGGIKMEYTRYEISGEHHIECACGILFLFDVDLSEEAVFEKWNRRRQVELTEDRAVLPIARDLKSGA